RAQAGHDLPSLRVGAGGGGEHERGGAVGDLRGVPGRDRAALGEGGAQTGEGGRSGVGADALVGGDLERLPATLRHGDRDDLLGQQLLRGGGALVGKGRDPVLVLARDLE